MVTVCLFTLGAHSSVLNGPHVHHVGASCHSSASLGCYVLNLELWMVIESYPGNDGVIMAEGKSDEFALVRREG